MEPRTREYLRGRFGDHYRRQARRTREGDGDAEGDAELGDEDANAPLRGPPAGNEREWGYIPFSEGGTTMVRHQSLLDLTGGGGVGEFLARERPRHVYFSAGRYDHPGADSMGQKGWRGADLVFDIDADHLPGVDEEADPYGEMLAAGKEALVALLDFLVDDFGFEDLTVVFSGGRGYHVHVRDEGVLELSREERREVVDYVRGLGIEFDDLVRTESVAGIGRKTPADKRTLSVAGGWSRRVHRHVMALVEELDGLDEDDGIARLREFDGVGEGKARAALNAVRSNREAVERGNIDVHSAVYSVSKHLLEETRAADAAPIDEPVTTDVNRLIRLPGSLHGGTGLVVTRIPLDGVDAFDPLTDAVADTFRENRIMVDVADPFEVRLAGERFNVDAGLHSVPEHVGVFAMARGNAEKGRE
ncbi:DNA primase small subunit PriS [Salinirubellus salinus]|uniref:DNA primase small subunit PriS n=1 Tax=Salinirubellus salinus TaxID=1364945 RepID=A0A9E7R5N9_9EURY|nr:DNA primase small subunit PriS [Salinirubellus salinus]UWM56279.1 DNA primase small subunit PriS [Salinirubellus salinus]